MEKLYIPYLRGSNKGDFTTRSTEARYGDGYSAIAPVGTNPDQEAWQLQTIPMSVMEANFFKKKLKELGALPFIWKNAPCGASSNYYQIYPLRIEWNPQGSLASLSFSVRTYTGVV